MILKMILKINNSMNQLIDENLIEVFKIFFKLSKNVKTRYGRQRTSLSCFTLIIYFELIRQYRYPLRYSACTNTQTLSFR